MLLRSMKAPPDDIAFAFAIRAHVLELGFNESWHGRAVATIPGLALRYFVHVGLGEKSGKNISTLASWCMDLVQITDIKVNRSLRQNMSHPESSAILTLGFQ